MNADPPAGTPDDPASAGQADERWAEIVASLTADTPDGTKPRWPAAEDVTPVPFRTWTPAVDPDDEHYRPPDPPPLPRLAPHTRWAILAIVAGVVVLVAPAALGNPTSGMVSVLAVLAILGGAATLVLRMRESREHRDDPDDGAVL